MVEIIKWSTPCESAPAEGLPSLIVSKEIAWVKEYQVRVFQTTPFKDDHSMKFEKKTTVNSVKLLNYMDSSYTSFLLGDFQGT